MGKGIFEQNLQSAFDLSYINVSFLQQSLIRQNSEKLGEFAEVAVLPKNQRSSHITIAPDNLTERDVEAQNACLPTLTITNTPQRHKKHFPVFMIGISLIEVKLYRRLELEHSSNQILLSFFCVDSANVHRG